jgi:hypothetical protein
LFEEVLPTIRKTGAYVSPNAEPVQVWNDPSYQQCEQCERDTTQIIWELQHQLLANLPLWNDIRKYHRLNLTTREIAALVKLSPASLRRQMKAMNRCGLLCPRSVSELRRMSQVGLHHKLALPVPYGISAQQGKQLQLFPVGVLEAGRHGNH